MEVVSKVMLETVARMKPISLDDGRGQNYEFTGQRSFNLAAWVEERNVPVEREGEWDNGGYRWVLAECPWNGHNDRSAYIVRFSNGAIAAGCHHNSCQAYGWRDLRQYYQPGCYDRTERNQQSETWADPVPLPKGPPPVAPFTPDMLPEALKDWIEDIALRMQVPSDFLGVGAMVVAGALVGRKLGIHPKRRDDWLVVPNIWGMIVGRPGFMKSPALAEVMKPLGRLIADSYARYREDLATYEREMESAWEYDEKPEQPSLRRYKVGDATTEKIVELLVENPNGLLVHRDELSGWLTMLDKQSREGDRAFYLESWNGTGSFDVDRIGRGSIHISALCLSILGSIQPGALSCYVQLATQGERGDDGLLQRFQLMVWPDTPDVWRNVDEYPDAEAKNRAYRVFERLDELEVETAEEGEFADEAIPALRFTPAAQERFDAWRNHLEHRLRNEEMSPALESHLAKYRSLMPSLALLFELIDSEQRPDAVEPTAASRAIAWCDYLETHVRRLYSAAEKPEIVGAQALLDRVRKGDVKDGASIRQIYQKGWAQLGNARKVEAALEVLQECNWLRLVKVETSGRPTFRIELHPSLRGVL